MLGVATAADADTSKISTEAVVYMRTLAVYLPSHHPTGDHYHDYGLLVDSRRERRMCDCAVCVAHNLQLLQMQSNDINDRGDGLPGVRFVTLPLESRCAISSHDDQLRLIAMLQQRPVASSYVVCGCAHCSAHRCLLRAYVEARQCHTYACRT